MLKKIWLNFLKTVTEMPFSLVVLYTGYVAEQSSHFCLFWAVYSYALFVIGLMLMAYGCVERYLLIFHRVFLNKHLISLHYGPLVFFSIYPPILYFGLIVIYSCENNFDYTQYVCGGPCYVYEVRFIEYIESVSEDFQSYFCSIS